MNMQLRTILLGLLSIGFVQGDPCENFALQKLSLKHASDPTIILKM